MMFFMRVAMPINWNLDASSLTNIARHNFREIGKIMNETKSFTLSATTRVFPEPGPALTSNDFVNGY